MFTLLSMLMSPMGISIDVIPSKEFQIKLK
jgi:hypothetical protein